MIKKFYTYINEKKDLEYKDFKIGDKVICRGGQDDILFRGEVGKIIGKYPENYQWLVKFETRFNTNLHDGNGKDPTRCSYFIYYRLLEHMDPEKQKEIDHKREEIRLKNIEIDPYGEEDWSE